MAEPRFVHLRVHSDYSMIDGLAKTGPLVKKAASLGMPALAITDFTNLCGLVKFYGTAHGAGLKPIIGADFHVQSELFGDEMTQLSVLAMNNTGYQNLTLLISKAYQRGYGAQGPWIDREWLAELNEGLLLISGGRMGDVGRSLLRGNSVLVDQCLDFYQQHFADRFYLELIRTGRAEVPGVILPVMAAAAVDARQVAIPEPDEFVERLLGVPDEVIKRFDCLAAFGLLSPQRFLLFALALLLSTQSLSAILCGLCFGNGSSALVAADYLALASRVEPFAAVLVCALTAGFLSHNHPQPFWQNVRGVRSCRMASGNRALTVQVM